MKHPRRIASTTRREVFNANFSVELKVFKALYGREINLRLWYVQYKVYTIKSNETQRDVSDIRTNL